MTLAGTLCAALFAFAFVAAPRSCEWGLEAYFWAGVALVVILAALPSAMAAGLPAGKRAGLALAFAAAGFGVWAAGLFAANVRIVCRLF